MQWALVNTEIMEHKNCFIENEVMINKTYEAQPGTIIDLIVYDGESLYNPPEGLKLVQVSDDARRGHTGY